LCFHIIYLGKVPKLIEDKKIAKTVVDDWNETELDQLDLYAPRKCDDGSYHRIKIEIYPVFNNECVKLDLSLDKANFILTHQVPKNSSPFRVRYLINTHIPYEVRFVFDVKAKTCSFTVVKGKTGHMSVLKSETIPLSAWDDVAQDKGVLHVFQMHYHIDKESHGEEPFGSDLSHKSYFLTPHHCSLGQSCASCVPNALVS
jgi:hypothetical protein